MAKISVIMPALNEADGIAAHLKSVVAHQPYEIIVSDGGSVDDTVAIAAACGARVVQCDRGRGRQMQAGAEVATGDVFLFLHADTILPEGAFEAIRDVLADASVLGGCFRLRFDQSGFAYSAYSWVTRFDSFFTSFGDAAIFVRRRPFERCGGYPNWPLLEDVEIRRRLRRIGDFRKVPFAVTTSARRFSRYGVVLTQLLNAAILLAFLVGISPQRLALWYGSGPR